MKNKEEKSTKYRGRFLERDYNSFKDDLLYLLEDYKKKSERLDKIIKQSDKTQLQLLKANDELDQYKKDLEKKVKEEIAKTEEKEKIIFEQSKFAAMGEMIDAVGHQWAQPLNLISLQIGMLGYEFEAGKVDQKYMDEFQAKMTQYIEHMNNTLSEFRTFFRPNKEQKQFNVKNMIEKVLFLVDNEIIKQNISIELNILNDFDIVGIENEFKHIILNIISNAKDAFLSHTQEKKVITINVDQNENERTIEIIDNAGGIPKSIIDKVFKANVTTKKDSNGTGIGLYMSEQIAKKNNGTITAQNVKDGAKFTFIQKIL